MGRVSLRGGERFQARASLFFDSKRWLRVSEQLVEMHQYGLGALVEMLKRCEGAIQRKPVRRTAVASWCKRHPQLSVGFDDHLFERHQNPRQSLQNRRCQADSGCLQTRGEGRVHLAEVARHFRGKELSPALSRIEHQTTIQCK